MAQHASALKHMRQSLKRRGRNRRNLSQVKTQIKKLRSTIEGGDAAGAKAALPETIAEIDKAVKKRVVHRNAAARYKSRLSTRINAASGANKG